MQVGAIFLVVAVFITISLQSLRWESLYTCFRDLTDLRACPCVSHRSNVSAWLSGLTCNSITATHRLAPMRSCDGFVLNVVVPFLSKVRTASHTASAATKPLTKGLARALALARCRVRPHPVLDGGPSRLVLRGMR